MKNGNGDGAVALPLKEPGDRHLGYVKHIAPNPGGPPIIRVRVTDDASPFNGKEFSVDFDNPGNAYDIGKGINVSFVLPEFGGGGTHPVRRAADVKLR